MAAALFSGFVATSLAQVMASAGAQPLISVELLRPIAANLGSGDAPVGRSHIGT
ncbi:hypothetical protein [Kamptonema formosum]|uniref:hypothetical protein n=1 Tax=Kamptonema formosum TaxID=331992 RepID=UPI000346B0B1|nr:hypothetical protein [Oscillatoria sp. PCC 10802]